MLHLKEPGCLVGEHKHVRDGVGVGDGFVRELDFDIEIALLEAME